MLSGAAQSVGANVSTNLGDLLGLPDERKPPAPGAQAPCCATSQRSGDPLEGTPGRPGPCQDACNKAGPASLIVQSSGG